MSLLDLVHGSYVHSRRVRVLSDIFADMLPARCSVLDIGCGDGLIAAQIGKKRPDLRISGADVLVRPSAAIPVRQIDGSKLPWESKSMDVAMFVDVLHHCEDPAALLAEAKRVARKAVLIKDHNLSGVLAHVRLSFMDRIGNARHGVSLRCTYFTETEWARLFAKLSLRVEQRAAAFQLYPFPVELLFGGRLHFICSLAVEE